MLGYGGAGESPVVAGSAFRPIAEPGHWVLVERSECGTSRAPNGKRAARHLVKKCTNPLERRALVRGELDLRAVRHEHQGVGKVAGKACRPPPGFRGRGGQGPQRVDQSLDQVASVTVVEVPFCFTDSMPASRDASFAYIWLLPMT